MSAGMRVQSSRDDAALRIQSLWRGSRGRVEVTKKLEGQILNEINTAATSVQKHWRGHSSRERTMHRLETMMEEEVSAAATKIQSSFRGHHAREVYSELLSSVSNTPRSELIITPRMPQSLQDDELAALDFRTADADGIKDKLLDIQNRASKIQITMGQIAPIFLDGAVDAAENKTPHRPFMGLEKHDDLSSLQVLIVGHSDLCHEIVSCLSRSGVSSVLIYHDLMAQAEDRSSKLEPYTKLCSPGTKVTTKLIDLSVDTEEFNQLSQESSIIVLCSCRLSDKNAVINASEQAAVPWLLVDSKMDSATFSFQFFTKGVIDVLEHDLVAAPMIRHMLNKKVLSDIKQLVEVVSPNAVVTFSSMLAQNVIKFWLGATEVLGYMWYCATFNKISSIPIQEIRRVCE